MNLVENKKALRDYTILEKFSAGAVLSGSEVKSLRAKNGKLDGSYVVVRGGEAFLVGSSIPPYQHVGKIKEEEAGRNRKLLLSKKELRELEDAEGTKGLTIVPLAWYNSKRYVKLSLAIARGRGKHDKREAIKERDSKREIARVLKRK